MLRLLRLVDQFNAIERELPDGWANARLVLTVADDARCDRAATLLAPANPGRLGKTIRFATARRGTGLGPEGVRRLLKRLDHEGMVADLALTAVEAAAPEERPVRETLRGQWDKALAALPPDWSDLYAEIRLLSTDYLEPAAVLLAPLNPGRYGGETGFRFRCAQRFGYGVSPEMAGRCFERCEEAGITGTVEILRVLSDTQPVGTQGPVWLVGGRAV
jgi:hypothetical protein